MGIDTKNTARLVQDSPDFKFILTDPQFNYRPWQG
jgi:hypothetical protein